MVHWPISVNEHEIEKVKPAIRHPMITTCVDNIFKGILSPQKCHKERAGE